jgi:gag-polyprotein putative aspartyl protease
MHIKTAVVVLCSLLGVITLAPPNIPTALADEVPPATQLGTRAEGVAAMQKVIKAIQDADIGTVSDMYRSSTDPVVHVISAMAIERIHFNLAAATRDARLCQQNLGDKRPAIALFCGAVEAGNLRLAGQYKASTDKVAELIRTFDGKGMDKRLVDFKALLESDRLAPPLTVERQAGTLAFDLRQGSTDYILSPTIAAKANGHALDMVVDSGASVVMLGEAQANHLGVKILGPAGEMEGWLSKGVTGKRGLLETLTLGGVTFHNMPVFVVPRQIALIGINYLAPLGAMHISASKLTISQDASTDTTCTTPMLIGSSIFGEEMELMPQLSVGGKIQPVLLDTGTREYLLGSKSALDEVTTLRRDRLDGFGDIGTQMSARARQAKVNLIVSGQSFDIYFDVLADGNVPWPIVMGASALRDMDFDLDFSRQRMCFALHPHLH